MKGFITIILVLNVQIIVAQDYNSFEVLFDNIEYNDNKLDVFNNRILDNLDVNLISIDLYTSVLFNYSTEPFIYDLAKNKIYDRLIEKYDDEGIEFLEYDDYGNEINSGK